MRLKLLDSLVQRRHVRVVVLVDIGDREAELDHAVDAGGEALRLVEREPGGQDRDVYQFDPKTSLIDRGLDLIRDFSRPMTPLGYKYIVEDHSAN